MNYDMMTVEQLASEMQDYFLEQIDDDEYDNTDVDYPIDVTTDADSTGTSVVFVKYVSGKEFVVAISDPAGEW